ncbi:methyltransferase domain-containing protein [Candidatus Vallotiella sp. (ex Adelges kitamiensis)]|uniref:methyltransferase domain-containing protein n=1 Tax=Candidatus Vallotiella sp. (ex Adelges kitamiensis) TaxID=2864217 RepID=UPI001CE2BBE1|nr:methyltransferase domain-containing protein [Candidatus Vallotia sp. (ex Adelges kitamiensis)]
MIFDRHAAQFPDVAFLSREIAHRMHERLQYINPQLNRILDAGCGMGEDIAVLRTRCVQATIYGVDLSRSMLLGAGHVSDCSNIPRWRRLLLAPLRYFTLGRVQLRDLVQADFGELPFAPEYFDLLWSNLALQWNERLDLVFQEWNRVLKADGMMMFSTLGPDTLRELRKAREVADGRESPNMLNFVDMHDYGDMLVANGFEIPVIDADTLIIMYSSPKSLLADVRRWGTMPRQNRYSDTSCHSISRGTYYRLIDALEAQRRPDGTIPLTFEVLYGYARKAAANMTHEGYSIIRINEIGHKLRNPHVSSS